MRTHASVLLQFSLVMPSRGGWREGRGGEGICMRRCYLLEETTWKIFFLSFSFLFFYASTPVFPFTVSCESGASLHAAICLDGRWVTQLMVYVDENTKASCSTVQCCGSTTMLTTHQLWGGVGPLCAVACMNHEAELFSICSCMAAGLHWKFRNPCVCFVLGFVFVLGAHYYTLFLLILLYA